MDKTLRFLLIASNYFRASQILLKDISDSKNRTFVISNKEITEEMLYEETKYSDTNLMIPILFSFYHGLELLIKGMIISTDKRSYKITNSINCLRL